MPVTPDELLARFAALAIVQRTYEHPAVFTVEEARALHGKLPGGLRLTARLTPRRLPVRGRPGSE